MVLTGNNIKAKKKHTQTIKLGDQTPNKASRKKPSILLLTSKRYTNISHSPVE